MDHHIENCLYNDMGEGVKCLFIEKKILLTYVIFLCELTILMKKW